MDEKIEKAIEKILNMYEKIENDLLIEIASHFLINDEFLNSDNWRIKKLEEMGLFNQDIIDYITRATKSTPKKIKEALNQINIDTTNMSDLNRLFEDEVLKINSNILINNFTINNIIDKSYDELSNTLIQMSNKIETSVRSAYLNIIEDVYLKTSMGTHSYQSAIREAINNLSNTGLKVLSYKTTDEAGNVTGIRNYNIESAVRREVLTASRQLSNKISMEIANELECEYIYLSEHLQCRPTHFDWQGTIIKREDLEKVTHYGEVDGLAGINCRHYFEPYFGDARGSDLKEYSEKECNKAYNLSQKQRYLESGIKKWKRKSEMFKANRDFDSYSKCKIKIRNWQSKIDKFTKDNNLKRDFNREYVLEVKNSSYKDVTQEWIKDVGTEKGLCKNQNYVIDSKNNKYKVDNKNVVLDHTKAEEDIAKWFASTKRIDINMLPRVLNPKNVKTADFIEKTTGITWEIKEPEGNTIGTTMLNQFKGQKEKAHKFIIDMHKSDMPLDTAIKEIEDILSNKRYNWIEEIVLLNDKELKKTFKR